MDRVFCFASTELEYCNEEFELVVLKAMKIELKLSDILNMIREKPEVIGNPGEVITGFASLDLAQHGDLSFVRDKKHIEKANGSKATALIVPRNLTIDAPDVAIQIKVDDPSAALSDICGSMERELYPLPFTGIDATSLIAPSSVLGESVSIGAFSAIEEQTSIGANTFVGRRVTIGAHSKIGAHVYIADNVVIGPHTEIGDGCNIHSGVVIGSPGFGYVHNKETGRHDPIPQVGRVVIDANVDIGANSTIDRARFGITRIGEGTKIDNMVQIGHNVEIGKHCILCAQVGIGGSSILHDYVVLAGKAGLSDHIEIASGVQVGGASGVVSGISEIGSKVWGYPAMEYHLMTKIAVLQKRLPDLFRRMGDFEKRLDALDGAK